MRSLLFVGSFDLRLISYYILVRAIPSCFRLVKMCLCQELSTDLDPMEINRHIFTHYVIEVRAGWTAPDWSRVLTTALETG
jgi:hypothetical protein